MALRAEDVTQVKAFLSDPRGEVLMKIFWCKAPFCDRSRAKTFAVELMTLHNAGYTFNSVLPWKLGRYCGHLTYIPFYGHLTHPPFTETAYLTPLAMAAHLNDPLTVKALLLADADPKYVGNGRLTAIDYVSVDNAFFGNLDMGCSKWPIDYVNEMKKLLNGEPTSDWYLI